MTDSAKSTTPTPKAVPLPDPKFALMAALVDGLDEFGPQTRARVFDVVKATLEASRGLAEADLEACLAWAGSRVDSALEAAGEAKRARGDK